MKNYYQTILGLPKKKEEAIHPENSKRRITHEKSLTQFQLKMVAFRRFVSKRTKQQSIHSFKITDDERVNLRAEALKYAGF